MKKFFASRWIVIVLLGLLLGLPVVISAATGGGIQHRHCITARDMIKLMSDLNLTQEQKQAIDTLKTRTQTALEPLRQQMKELRSQMRETFLAAEIDTAKADVLSQQMIQLAGQIENIVIHARLQKAQILTPEQRAMVLSKMKDVQECRQGREAEQFLFPGLRQ